MNKNPIIITPFPGNRNFTEKESRYFFGRGIETAALKAKIRKDKFVALVGQPNVGKTSLIQGGLKPSLKSRFSAKSGTDWIIVELDSSKNLFEDLGEKLTAKNSKLINPKLRISPKFKKNRLDILKHPKDKGLVKIYKNSPHISKYNVLIVIDHFEKVVDNIQGQENFEKTIKILNNAIQDASTSIYVLIVMHKETYDIVNKPLDNKFSILRKLIKMPFFLHKMTESGLQEAITQPIKTYNQKVKVDPELRRDIITDIIKITDTKTQLPKFQEILTKIWENWRKSNCPPIISSVHYKLKTKAAKKVKSVKKAAKLEHAMPSDPSPVRKELTLEEHAESIYQTLRRGQKEICISSFQMLLKRRGEAFERDIISVQEIQDKTKETIPIIIATIRLFIKKNILSTPDEEDLSPDSMIELAPNFKIEGWNRIEDWMIEKDALQLEEFVDFVKNIPSSFPDSEEEKQEKEELKAWWETNKLLLLPHSDPKTNSLINNFFNPPPPPKPVEEQKPKRRKISIKRR